MENIRLTLFIKKDLNRIFASFYHDYEVEWFFESKVGSKNQNKLQNFVNFAFEHVFFDKSDPNFDLTYQMWLSSNTCNPAMGARHRLVIN